MHTPAKFLAAALLALSCHAYADPAADIMADWGKLGETQQTMVFLRVATLYTAMELEQAKLPDSRQRNASEPDDAGQRPASSAVAAHAISNTLLRTGDNGGASDG